MKLLVKNDPAGQRGLGDTGYSVPNTTITWISVIYLLVNVLAASLGNLITGIPQSKNDSRAFELKNKNFQLQLLQRVLSNPNDEDRKLSLDLLVKAHLLDAESDLATFIKENKRMPLWEKRDIEQLNSYQGSGGSAGSFPSTSMQMAARDTGTIPPGNVDTARQQGGGSKQRGKTSN